MSSISLSLSSTLKSRHFSLSQTLPIHPSSINLQLPRVPPLRARNLRVRVRVSVITAQSRTSSSNGGGVNVPLSIKPGRVVESDLIPSDVRKRAMDAVDSLGGRVTIGDVASKAGLKLNEAQKALQALAADSDGFLEVSDEGDVLYVLPKDYRAKLVGKSLRMKIEPWAEKAKSTAEYLIRVTFGTTLVASIVLVFLAIIAIMTSGDSEKDSGSDRSPDFCSKDDNRKRRGGRSYDSGFVTYFNPTDLLWYWDRDYYRRPRKQEDSGGMKFIEAVFSFVFGDGDPNQGIEEKRWKLIGQYIAANGGVVTAEELAPYLDVQTKQESDDSYILPVLLRFDGQPQVDEQGNILYRFPSLQRTASSAMAGRKEYFSLRQSNRDERVPASFKEKKWKFSKASPEQKAMVIGLGAINSLGVIILSSLLKDTSVIPSGYVSFVAALLPALQVYAASFFAIPVARWFLMRKANLEIEKRNQARKQSAIALEVPDASLRRKLISARKMAERTFIGKERIVYSTDKDLDEQDYEKREWERRFQELERSD